MNEMTSRRGFVHALACSPVAASGAALIAGSAVAEGTKGIANGYLNPRKALLWESTRKEVRELIEGGDLKAIIIPTGATEQHHEHMAMIQDTASATLIAHEAALTLYPEVMVATPVPVGISPYWMQYKGTLTLRKETFLAVVYEICESLQVHGIKKILILNGHGGNATPLKQTVGEFRRKLDMQIEAHSYWDAFTPQVIQKHLESKQVPGHASEMETSIAMAAFPERIRWEALHAAAPDDEVANQAKLSTSEKGGALITVAVEWVVNRLREMIRKE